MPECEKRHTTGRLKIQQGSSYLPSCVLCLELPAWLEAPGTHLLWSWLWPLASLDVSQSCSFLAVHAQSSLHLLLLQPSISDRQIFLLQGLLCAESLLSQVHVNAC